VVSFVIGVEQVAIHDEGLQMYGMFRCMVFVRRSEDVNVRRSYGIFLAGRELLIIQFFSGVMNDDNAEVLDKH
jgi:hypothetical protein